MPQVKALIILTILAISVYSCDCNQTANGKVLDANTKQPIDSVKIFKMGEEKNTLTDANGNFKLFRISGGLGGCPALIIVLSKQGYQSKSLEVTSDSLMVIYLHKD